MKFPGDPLSRRRKPRSPAIRLRRKRVSRPQSPFSHPTTTAVADPLPNPKTDSVSARKLAAGLWRLQVPETLADHGTRSQLQHGLGYVDLSSSSHPNGMRHGDLKIPSQSLHSISGTKDGHFCELKPCFPYSSTAMEGATKWDPVCLITSDEAQHIYKQMELLDQKVSAVSAASALESELEQAHARIQELEAERHASEKKLEHFLKKVSEERTSRRSREHEKIRAYVEDIKAELNRERKSCQRIELVNSRLVNELADAKLLSKRYVQDYEKERKARVLMEEVCNELAKEIGEDKAEIEALQRESMKFREEVEEERKMLQMAEVWREERVQMKLIDAKVALDEKYTQMNKLVADMETFLKSVNLNPNAKEMTDAQSLQQAAAAVNIDDMKEFSYEPPNPDDILSIFEDVNSGEPKEREIETCVAYSLASHASKIHTVSPEACVIDKDSFKRHSYVFMDENGDIEEDESGWETVNHVEEQGSSCCSPEGSVLSMAKNCCESNLSGQSGLEWEENAGKEIPITEISEVFSVPTKQSKKASSIARLWKSGTNNANNYKLISIEGMNMNGRLSNGRVSNGGIISPDWVLGKGGLSPQDLVYQFGSPESGNLHKKGCLPRSAQKNSLKARLLEARNETQKVQLRHVLKQKI